MKRRLFLTIAGWQCSLCPMQCGCSEIPAYAAGSRTLVAGLTASSPHFKSAADWPQPEH